MARSVSADDALGVEAGKLVIDSGDLVRAVDATWSSFVAELEFVGSENSTLALFATDQPFVPGLGVTGVQGVSFELNGSIQLVATNGLIDGARSDVYAEFFPILPGLSYALRYELQDFVARTALNSPIAWHKIQETDDQPWISGLASLGNAIAFSASTHLYLVTAEDDFTITAALQQEEFVSAVRIWEVEGSHQLGICIPDRHQVNIGPTEIRRTGILSWPFGDAESTVVLGSFIGQADGDFVFPLSFDRSPDGRIYVLDAGNGRIQVFDETGAYITQWGSRGSRDGEFDFGAGSEPTDFEGSIVVDGFIYVADVGNKRIQKFAP